MTRRKAYGPIVWARHVPDMLRSDGQPDTTAHAVLGALAGWADKDTGDNARPGVAALAAATRFRADVVQAALERCEMAKLISRVTELTGGTVVWRLHLEMTADGPSVHDRREDQRRATNAERQRRYRKHRAGDHALCAATEDCHATARRDVTPSDDVTVTPPHGVTVTPPDDDMSRHEQRYVTPRDGVCHATSTVITAGHPGYIPNDPQLHPHKNKETSPTSPRRKPKTTPAPRPDVEQLCERLRDRVAANDVKARVTDTWRTAARLLLDRDGRDLDQALRLIDWATQHKFWHRQILSIPTFREKYDRLLLDARAEHQRDKRPTTADRVAGWQALKSAPAEPNARLAGWQALKSGGAPQLAATGTEGLPLLYALPESRQSRGEPQ